MTRRFRSIDDDWIETGIRTAKLFREDLVYLQDHGLPVRTVLREALRMYVEDHKRRTPHPVESAVERERFILRGLLPDGTRVPDRPERTPIVAEIPNMHLPIEPHEVLEPAVIRAMTHAERMSWIMTGRLPGHDGDEAIAPTTPNLAAVMPASVNQTTTSSEAI